MNPFGKRQATASLFHRLCRLGPKPMRAGMASKAQLGRESLGINDTTRGRTETLHAQLRKDFVCTVSGRGSNFAAAWTAILIAHVTRATCTPCPDDLGCGGFVS